MDKYEKILLIINIERKKLLAKGLDLSADDILAYLLEVKWRDGRKRSISEMTNDVLKIDTKMLSRFIAAQSVISAGNSKFNAEGGFENSFDEFKDIMQKGGK